MFEMFSHFSISFIKILILFLGLPECRHVPNGPCEFNSRTVQIDEMTADDSPLNFPGCGHLVDVGVCEFDPPGSITFVYNN